MFVFGFNICLLDHLLFVLLFCLGFTGFDSLVGVGCLVFGCVVFFDWFAVVWCAMMVTLVCLLWN